MPRELAVAYARRGAAANLCKPAGMTSHDVVAHCRKLLGGVKTGHTGTLDPAAAGVLVLGFGAATRLFDYVLDDTKEYRGEFALGVATDTDDAEGEVLSTSSAVNVDRGQVEACLAAFKGKLKMTAPVYSAQKQAGQPLYKRARAGEEVKPRSRDVEIFKLDLLEFVPGEVATVMVDVGCSKGTYMRSLARMLGEALGVGGHLKALVRTRVGGFLLEDSLTLEEFEQQVRRGEAADAFEPMSSFVEHLPVALIEESAAQVFAYGQGLSARQVHSPLPAKFGQLVRVETSDGRLVALARSGVSQAGPGLVPVKVFVQPGEDAGC